MKFKQFLVYSKNSDVGERVKDAAEKHSFEYSCESPDFVISVGGDGTFLEAERKFPGVPKLLVRDSKICCKCSDKSPDEMLKIIRSGKSRIQEVIKIEAIHPKGKLLAVNDIVLRNQNLTRALRFKLSVDGEEIYPDLIGDGVVIATPFGSTAYYKSVARSTISGGIGIAFNNITEKKEPLLIDENSELTLEITRENGDLAADNDPTIATVGPGNRIAVRKAPEVARLISHE